MKTDQAKSGPLTQKSDWDYELEEGASIWITIGNRSLWISGILGEVCLYERGKETETPLEIFPLPSKYDAE